MAKLHAYRYKRGRGCNVKVWFLECPLFGGKNTLQKRFGTKDSVRCFRGGRFSEVANVLQVWDFQSVSRTLSALVSVSASRSVRSGRFYCNSPPSPPTHTHTHRLIRFDFLFHNCSIIAIYVGFHTMCSGLA